MPIKVDNRNEFSDCASLEQSVPQHLEDQANFPLIIEVRCGWQPLILDSVSLRMGLKGATVRLTLQNCDVKQDSLFADERKNFALVERITEEVTQKVSHRRGLEGRAGLAHNAGTVSIKGTAGKRANTSTKRVSINQRNVTRVRAGGSTDRPIWPIVALPDEDIMQGKYLGSEAVCEIKRKESSWRITATLTFAPYEIVVDNIQLTSGRKLRITPNKRKIVARLVGNLAQKPKEGFQLCKSTLEYNAE
jgi:hypothetical protein